MRHIAWLNKLESELDQMYGEILKEYLTSYEELESKIERFNARIEELEQDDCYKAQVSKLGCFIGIKTHTALSMIVETGDFNRFPNANSYAAFLGLPPGEHSSSTSVHRLSITKAGNSHCRTLLVESSGGICKGTVCHKSKALRARQASQKPDVIAYADKTNTRLRSKYYRMMRHGKKTECRCYCCSKGTGMFHLGNDDWKYRSDPPDTGIS